MRTRTWTIWSSSRTSWKTLIIRRIHSVSSRRSSTAHPRTKTRLEGDSGTSWISSSLWRPTHRKLIRVEAPWICQVTCLRQMLTFLWLLMDVEISSRWWGSSREELWFRSWRANPVMQMQDSIEGVIVVSYLQRRDSKAEDSKFLSSRSLSQRSRERTQVSKSRSASKRPTMCHIPTHP